jgi:hypothetical protein
MGYETFLARRETARGKWAHPLEFSSLRSLVGDSISYRDALKAADCILVVLSVLQQGLGPARADFPSKEIYSFFRRFLRGVLFYVGELGMDTARFEQLVDGAIGNEFSGIALRKRDKLVGAVAEYREKQEFFTRCIDSLLNGCIPHGALTLPSVRRHFRNRAALDIPAIADEYGIVEYERTRLFGGIRCRLLDGRFLPTDQLSR